MLAQVLRELFPVFVLLYLIDALAYVRRSQLLLSPGFWGGWKLKGPGVRLASLWPGDLAFVITRPGAAVSWDPADWAREAGEGLPAPELEAAAFDLAALEARLETVRSQTAVLRWACLAFALALLVLLPGVLYLYPSLLAPVLGLTAAAYLTVLGTAFWTAARLRRSGISRPGGALPALVFSPPAAVHAASGLAREALQGFDALTLAAALLPREELLRRARASLHGAECAIARSGEAGWRGYWAERRRGVLDLLEKAGISEKLAAAPPQKRDPEAESYCPVCGSEYLKGFAGCDECGLPLLSFSSHPAE